MSFAPAQINVLSEVNESRRDPSKDPAVAS